MKKSEKISVASGIGLLVVAALFLVALLLQLLPFGGTGAVPVFSGIGSLLFGAYGYSSLLIPAFFFAAGVGCFLFPWSERIGVMYASSFVPFFTVVITEKICADMLTLGNSPLVGIQVAAAIIVCILLLGIEYFAASVVGGIVQSKWAAFTSRKDEPVADSHPPIFPQGVIREDVIHGDVQELQEEGKEERVATEPPVQETESPKVDTEPGGADRPVEPVDVDSGVAADELPLVLPLEEEFDLDLEETMAIESVPVEDEAVDSVPDADFAPRPIPVEEAAPISLQEVAAVPSQEIQTEPGLSVHAAEDEPSLPPVQARPDAEAELEPDLEQLPLETAAGPDATIQNQEEELEDVFGEDFFATAPVPTEDVFSKEYLDSLHAHRQAARQETIQAEEVRAAQSQTDAGALPTGAQNAGSHQDAPKAVAQVQGRQDEQAVAPQVHFQPIPHYSLNPHASAERVAEVQPQLAAQDFDNPQEAAFFEDPFGEGKRLEDAAVIAQAQSLENQDSQLQSPQFMEDDAEVVQAEDLVADSPDETAFADGDSLDDDFFAEEEFDLEEPQAEERLRDGASGGFSSAGEDFEETQVEEDFLPEEDVLDNTELALQDGDALEGPELVSPDLDGDFFMDDDLEEELDLKADELVEEDDGTMALPSEASAAEPDFTEEAASSEEYVVEEVTFGGPRLEVQPLAERSVPRRVRGPYTVPAADLLTAYPGGEYWVIDDETLAASEELKDTLGEFKIEAEVTGIRKGPVITMFEILPAPGVKLSKIVALQDNIALRLAASSVRIVAPIPGKHAVGIEVPNKERAIVSFRELIDTENPAFRKQAVPVVLGKDITGEAQVIDLAKTPHLLIAGSTGSGKSVCVNSLILSILFKRSPQEVRMILIDPKIVELKLYNDIPHLLTPVITEPKKAFQALQYCLCEMERRYALLDGMGVREITSYNKRIVERNIATEKLPYIVVIIDEFADLMATTGKELESTVARLAAMSRAVGIHLVLATQRPSIDVITGLIKANIPSRVAFMVASKMDSRIIIDQVGAEKLLGKGDMLYASATDPFPVRIQGTFVSDNEVESVVDFVKQYGEPDYIDDEIFVDEEDEDMGPSLFGEGDDPLYDQAVEIVMQAGKASASYIQRRLKIGYNRAARLVEEMEEKGLVGPANGSKPREIIQLP